MGSPSRDDCCENSLAGKLAPFQVLGDPTAEARQALAEFEQPFVLRRVALFSELGVVTILLATAGIDSGRLKMPAGIRAEPGVVIGRWQSNRIEAIDFAPVSDTVSIGIEIGPITAHSLAADARLRITAVAQQLLHSTRLGG